MTKLLYLTSLRRDRVESGPGSILRNLPFLDEGRIVWQNGIIMNYFGVANMFWSTNQMVNGESYHNICQNECYMSFLQCVAALNPTQGSIYRFLVFNSAVHFFVCEIKLVSSKWVLLCLIAAFCFLHYCIWRGKRRKKEGKKVDFYLFLTHSVGLSCYHIKCSLFKMHSCNVNVNMHLAKASSN